MIKMRNASRGFTLVELMVALVIALVAMLAATELYIGTRQTYRIQGMQSRLAEDGRFAQSMLQRIILQAGFRPLPQNALPLSYITPVDATSFTVNFIGDGVSAVNCDGAPVPDAAVTSLTISGGGGNLSCRVGAGAGAVASNWITASGNGTLLRDFSVEYGVDTGPIISKNYGCGDDSGADNKVRDCVADVYDLAQATAAPASIVALRLCFVLSTEDTDMSVAKTAAYPDCAGNNIANSQNDRRLYRTFRSTVLVRNH